jgi:CDP-diacylglycerol---serine O-phosphatidyltransferase
MFAAREDTYALFHMKKYLPNLFTLLNLTIGSLGTILALQGKLTHAALCIWLGAFFDFLDGWLARLFGTYSPLGRQLDSLADLMTFGWLPASIMYVLISQQTASAYLPYVALLILNFSALRLARFSIDTRQKNVFIGLPVPANGVLISTLPLIITNNKYAWLTAFLTQPYTLVILIIVTSCLLIANFQLMAFKFATYAWYPNRFKYGFLLAATLLILLLRAEGLALSIFLYVLVSLVSRLQQQEQ